MGVYVFTPAGPDKLQNNILEKCVEYIGSRQVGYGSNSAKGRRYLKHELNCSGRAIKRTISKKYKIINNREFETFGIAVYYFHSDFCAEIVEKIIDYIDGNADDIFKNHTFGCIPIGEKYLNLSYAHRLSQLEWVQNEDYYGQGEKARNIKEKFDILKNNLSR